MAILRRFLSNQSLVAALVVLAACNNGRRTRVFEDAGGSAEDGASAAADAASLDAALADAGSAPVDAQPPRDAAPTDAFAPDATVSTTGPWASTPSETLAAPSATSGGFGATVDVSPDGTRLVVGDMRYRETDSFTSPFVGAAHLYERGVSAWSATQTIVGTGDPDTGFANAVLFARPDGSALFASLTTYEPETSVLFRLAESDGAFAEPTDRYSDGLYSNNVCWGASLTTTDDGESLFVGDPCFAARGEGAVQINTPDGWFKLDAPPDADSFGTSLAVSADGSRLYVGAFDAGDGRGAILVYEKASSGYYVATTLSIASPTASRRFGDGLALSRDGATVFVGDTGGTAGVVYAFTAPALTSDSERPAVQTFVSPTGSTSFGAAVGTMADGSLVVGDPNASIAGGGRGAVYIYPLR